MDQQTTKSFQLALPFALLPASPALAALHSSPLFTLSHPHSLCKFCGIYLHLGNSATKTIRRRRTKNGLVRIITTNCYSCGAINDVVLNKAITPQLLQAPSSDSSQDPSLQSHSAVTPTCSKTLPGLPSTHTIPYNTRSSPVSPARSPLVPSTEKQKRARPKKTGLQELLARTREAKEAKRNSDNKESGGLSAFLNDL